MRCKEPLLALQPTLHTVLHVRQFKMSVISVQYVFVSAPFKDYPPGADMIGSVGPSCGNDTPYIAGRQTVPHLPALSETYVSATGAR